MHAPAQQPIKRLLRLRLNGRWREDAVAEKQMLVDYLREVVHLTGGKTGCGGGECGACTVVVEGGAVPSCITLAVRCEGRHVETVEGLATQVQISKLQQAFHEKLGTQCGVCPPAMIRAAEALLRKNPKPSEKEIRAALAGNLCRCTGYVKIIESVQAAAGQTLLAPIPSCSASRRARAFRSLTVSKKSPAARVIPPISRMPTRWLAAFCAAR